MAGPDLDAVADELYALHPGEFVTVRDARAKEARAAGDRETAGLISALRKPTVVAWLSNQLARRHAGHVQPLLELGEALREATATLSGPELRQLSRQRAQLVHALVEEARGVAAAAGQRVSEETLRGVESTLHAALADPDAARQLVEGRLSDGLAASGFGPADGSSPAPAKRSVPPSRRAAAKGSAAEDRRAGRRAEVEKELGAAWAEAGRAAEQRDQAEEAARRAERTMADLTRDVERLRDELDRAESELRAAVEARDAAAATYEQAEREARRTRQRVTDLQARLDTI